VNIPTKQTKVEFNLLEPNTFYLRVIYDDNNKKVDTSNYLEKLQPEVIHFQNHQEMSAPIGTMSSFLI
jgi:hypothetical protein